ncbi:hypothetical protein C2W62_42745 [Candidatus Entotheonella serta]|nr:hypothetical protein C2W62_42745 [Candidatus Entotheonella serta]
MPISVNKIRRRMVQRIKHLGLPKIAFVSCEVGWNILPLQKTVRSTKEGSGMSAIVKYPHLTSDEPGAVRIGRTRYKVIHLASEHYHYGWSAEELMRQHPDLRPEEVYVALTYFYDHYDEFV